MVLSMVQFFDSWEQILIYNADIEFFNPLIHMVSRQGRKMEDCAFLGFPSASRWTFSGGQMLAFLRLKGLDLAPILPNADM